MRALRFSAFGPPSVLSIQEIQKPEPGDGEVLIQVKAAAINPSDAKNVSGHFSATTLPRTPGRDFSGIVVKGKKFEGEEVWGSAPGFGITRDGVLGPGGVIEQRGVIDQGGAVAGAEHPFAARARAVSLPAGRAERPPAAGAPPDRPGRPAVVPRRERRAHDARPSSHPPRFPPFPAPC